MCKILHIETATEVCSVSIAEDGKIISSRETFRGRSHASVLSVFIRELLKETGLLPDNLDAIAVSMGPGSYTGLRIGVSTAKGLCYGSDLPLIAIPTLTSMCYGILEKLKEIEVSAEEKLLLVPMIDARRMEVYTAFYNKDLTEFRKTCAIVVEPDTFNDLLRQYVLIFFGDGSKKLTDTIIHPHANFITDFQASSDHMAKLAYACYLKNDFVDVAYFEPYYLKEFITTAPKKKVL